MPRYDRTSDAFDGGAASFSALTLAGVGDIPVPENVKPKNSILGTLSIIFEALIVRPDLYRRVRTFWRARSCSACVLP